MTTINPKAKFEVVLEATAHWSKNDDLVVEMETNLPNGTSLHLEVRCGNIYEETEEHAFLSEADAVVSGGKVVFKELAERSEMIHAGYDLVIEMDYTLYQSESVRAVVGEKGEYMTGKLVHPDSKGEFYHVIAYFTMIFQGNDIVINPAEDYYYTTFSNGSADNPSEGFKMAEPEDPDPNSLHEQEKTLTFGPLSEYMFDYVRWHKDIKNKEQPFSRAFQEYQELRDKLYDSQDYNSASYGYTEDNPIMGNSTVQVNHFVMSLQKNDGKDWRISYSGKKRTTVHGQNNVLVYEYSVSLDEEEYCKIYACPFGRGSIYTPRGFIVSEDVYIEKSSITMFRCIGCNTEMLPNEKFCYCCGTKNAFYDSSYNTSMLQETEFGSHANTLWDTIKCENCAQQTRQRYFCNDKVFDARYCVRCGKERIVVRDKKQPHTVFRTSWSTLVDTAFGAKRINFDFSLYSNGDIQDNDVILENRVNQDRVDKIFQIINTYKPILYALQPYSAYDSRGEEYHLSFDNFSLSALAIRKSDLYSIRSSQVNYALLEDIVTELLSEISEILSNDGITIKLASGIWSDLQYNYNPELENEIKNKREALKNLAAEKERTNNSIEEHMKPRETVKEENNKNDNNKKRGFFGRWFH